VSIAVVIVNYRTPDLVMDCLRSLAGEVAAGQDLRVFVGDADSGDGSFARISEFIRDAGLDWARCLEIGVNGGFAYGNNFLLGTCVLPDPAHSHVHFLNPDTVVHPGAVAALARFLDAHPDAGVAGSRLENPDGSPRSFAFRFPAPWREFFRGARFSVLERLVPSSRLSLTGLDRPTPVDWVTGASFMMPRAVLERVGAMDARYFLYFEETDLMARVRKAGLTVWHVPESRVVHLAGQSTGHRPGERGKPLSPHWLRSRSRFLRTHHGAAGQVLGTVLFLAGDLFYRLRCLMLLRKAGNPPGMWRDYLRYGFRKPPAEPN